MRSLIVAITTAMIPIDRFQSELKNKIKKMLSSSENEPQKLFSDENEPQKLSSSENEPQLGIFLYAIFFINFKRI